MMNPVIRLALATSLLLTVSGCAFTEQKPQLDLSWERVENQADVTEGISMAGFFGDINFLVGAKTPTQCYGVVADLDANGTSLTVHVGISPSASGICAQQPGGVRYTGVIRNLSHGTYTVHIIQNVSGVGLTDYNQTVTL